MRYLPMAFLSLLTIALTQLAPTGDPIAARSLPSPDPFPASAGGEGADRTSAAEFLKYLDIDVIAKAHAAECEDEGEICKTNADCCSGLECTGEPQPTCRPQE